MVCEVCGEGRVTLVTTADVGGEKKVSYLCDRCRREAGAPRSSPLERPCSRCGEQEGTVKLVRVAAGLRTVTFVCQACASVGGRKG